MQWYTLGVYRGLFQSLSVKHFNSVFFMKFTFNNGSSVDNSMNLLDMSCHVSFLIELPAALGNWTCEWFVICVCPLMREKLIHTFEDLHAHSWVIGILRLAEEVRRYTLETATLYHLLKYREGFRNIQLIALCFVGCIFSPTTI